MHPICPRSLEVRYPIQVGQRPVRLRHEEQGKEEGQHKNAELRHLVDHDDPEPASAANACCWACRDQPCTTGRVGASIDAADHVAPWNT